MSPFRTNNLESVLSRADLVRSWKTIRSGLRKQAIVDLHDFLDIHRSIAELTERLEGDIAGGSFRPRESEVVRLEKQLGIPRRLVIPSAVDALVLQAIIDSIEASLLNRAPTQRAYYGRSHTPPGVQDVDDSFPYPWWLLWPEFQERIWKYASDHNWVVMTDIANYFDSIPLSRLRNKISAASDFDEELIDLLFYLLESFVWRPEYIPFSGVGLPQIAFDAPRLLAHVYLFDVDKFLDAETGGDFVRWMDDIDFGVDSVGKGKRILRDLDTLMASSGLRLNSGKTKIFCAKAALEYLWVNENRALTLYSNLISNSSNPSKTLNRVSLRALKRYRIFYRKARSGVWIKVLKRYLTLLSKVQNAGAVIDCPVILRELPAAREWVFQYFSALGYSPKRFSIVLDYIKSEDCLDDVSIFQACKLLVLWDIPPTSVNRAKMLQLAKQMSSNAQANPASFSAGLWVMAKYGSTQQLEQYLNASRKIWRKSEWAARQTAAVTPLLDDDARSRVETSLHRFGLFDALSVLASLREIRGLNALDRQLSGYLTHASNYTLGKFIVAKQVVSGSLDPQSIAQLRTKLDSVVSDRNYRLSLGL